MEMASITAHMLVGKVDDYHGGIIPTYELYLWENSRPAWILVKADTTAAPTRHQPWKKVVWIPTVEHMLEDAVAMAGLHAIEDPDVVELGYELGIAKKERVELYRDISAEDRARLYMAARRISWQTKVSLSVFSESTILRQLPILSHYDLDVEVCAPTYLREHSMWRQRPLVLGSLDAPERLEEQRSPSPETKEEERRPIPGTPTIGGQRNAHLRVVSERRKNHETDKS
ncbi:MAG: hypothetical protein OWU84_04050 [Firmicutes bacterium]|nr:hypothetical protein [Bacillota bacterium]